MIELRKNRHPERRMDCVDSGAGESEGYSEGEGAKGRAEEAVVGSEKPG